MCGRGWSGGLLLLIVCGFAGVSFMQNLTLIRTFTAPRLNVIAGMNTA